jgi:hypothetical protein
MYLALNLTKESHLKLRNAVSFYMMENTDVKTSEYDAIYCHHMTVALNEPYLEEVGKSYKLTVNKIAFNLKVIAVSVTTECKSTNNIKHITCFVDKGRGGKPFMSNHLNHWFPIPEIELEGIVTLNP